MIDILMLTRADHANTGWRFSKCLESLGLKVECYKAQTHPCNYPVQMPVHPELAAAERTCVRPTILKIAPGGNYSESSSDFYINYRMGTLMRIAKVIHFHATTFVDSGVDLSNKKVIVQHAGSCYQKNPGDANKLFNPIANKTIVQYPSLMELGAKGEELIYYPVDTKTITPVRSTVITDPRQPKKVLIGHWPSSPARKGTENILKVIEELEEDKGLKGKFKYVGIKKAKKWEEIVDWEDNLDRMSRCDIIVERCQIGDGHSEWANTAIEAAALGKTVITNTQSSALYEEQYGEHCPLLIANTSEDLHRTLKYLIKLPHLLSSLGKRNREWVIRCHSMEATAKRLWEKVYENLITN